MKKTSVEDIALVLLPYYRYALGKNQQLQSKKQR